MRRFLWAAGITAASICLMAGCSSQEGGKQKLYIYNWTYYIPDDVLRDFEKEFHAEVVYDMYASNEEMYAKLKAGGAGYDLVFPSGDYVSIMASQGMLDKIDRGRTTAFGNLDTAVLVKIKYDPGCSFSVPYMMGAAGITVNNKQIPDFEKSWNIFNRSDLAGRMTLLDDMREVLGAALITLGYSVNSIDTAQLLQAKAQVMGWRKNIVKFDAEAFGKGFAAGEFWVVHGYAENVFLELDSSRRGDASFFIPREGSSMYMDNLCILKSARHKELAYAFISFIHRPEIYARIVDFLMLPSINVPARALRKVHPNYEIADLMRSEFKEDLGEHLALYNQIWQEILIGR